MTTKAATIKVTSARSDGRVALWEKHPDHPTGEIFIAGDTVVEAAETARVLRAIADGDVQRVEEKKVASK